MHEEPLASSLLEVWWHAHRADCRRVCLAAGVLLTRPRASPRLSKGRLLGWNNQRTEPHHGVHMEQEVTGVLQNACWSERGIQLLTHLSPPHCSLPQCRRLERASFSAMGASPTGSASPGMPPQPLATPPDMQPVAMHGGGPGGGDKSAHRLAAPATPSPQELDRLETSPICHVVALFYADAASKETAIHISVAVEAPHHHICSRAIHRRRSFRDSGDGAAYGAPPRPDPSRPVTPELPPHPQPAYQQAAYQQAAYQQAAYQQPLHRPPPEHRAPQQESAPRHTHTDDYAPSPSQQRQPQHAQLRTPPQHSLVRGKTSFYLLEQ